MPLELVWEPNGVFRRFHGNLIVDDLIQAVQLVHEDPRFEDMNYSINCFLEVTALMVGTSDVLRLVLKTVQDNLINRKSIRTAIVTDNDKVRAFAAHFIDPRYIPHETTIVATLDEARQWVAAQTL